MVCMYNMCKWIFTLLLGIFQETQNTVYFFNSCSFLAEFMYNGIKLQSRHNDIHKTPLFI